MDIAIFKRKILSKLDKHKYYIGMHSATLTAIFSNMERINYGRSN